MISRNFRPWFRFRNSRTRSYTLRGALIEPKYFPSGHCIARPMIDVPQKDRSTSTPSATGASASSVARGVAQRSDQCAMSLIFMPGVYIAVSADGQDRLSIHSLHRLSPSSSAASLLLKTAPLIRLTSTTSLGGRGEGQFPVNTSRIQLQSLELLNQ